MTTVNRHPTTPANALRSCCTLLLLLILASLTTASANDWTPRLSGQHDMDLASCPFTLTQRPQPARVVLQVIQNTFHKWEEHDLPDGRTCLVQIEPTTRTLTPTAAGQLLHNSSAWIHQTVTPPPQPNSDEAGQEREFAIDEQVWGDTRIEIQNVHGEDERSKVANTLQYPYVASGFLYSEYGFTGIGSGCSAFLVSPHTALTNGHCIVATRKNLRDLDEKSQGHDVELGDRASAVYFSAGQYNESGELTRPFGLRPATNWDASDDYVSELLKWFGNTGPYDYGVVHFNQSFAALGIDTYVPVVFNAHPEEIAIAGYPGEVHGSSNDGSMWQSSSPVEQINDRTLSYKADTSDGMSGSPIWQVSPLRVVGLHAYGGFTTNGGPRLVTENEALISGWMNWDPPPSAQNNQFENATTLHGDTGSVVGSTSGAYSESGEPMNCGANRASVWWRWTPATSGLATFYVDTGGVDLIVFSGTRIDDLSSITGCVQRWPSGPHPFASAEVEAAKQYFVSVSTPINSPRDFEFSWIVEAAGDAPSVTSFSASPTSIIEGSPSTLSWSVSGSEPINLFISSGVGEVTGLSSATVYPATTTTYTLTATNTHGSDSRQVTVNVTPDSNGGQDGLIARITTNPVGQARVNQVVTLDGTNSTFGDGNRSVYEFDSGDGRTRQEAWGEWIMNYPNPGSYQPCVRVRNTLNQWSPWACTNINIVNEAATGPDLTILSYEPAGWIGPSNPPYVGIDHGNSFGITVNWWNDGAPLPADHPRFFLQLLIEGQPIASRSYSAGSRPPGEQRTFTGLGSNLEPGEYTVVIMIDATNAIQETNELNNSRSFTLEVYSVPPIADFNVSTECLTATFTDASAHPMGNSNITRRTWDFRDGNTSTQRDPTHTYEAPGTYNARLTVEDKWGNTHTRTRSVNVQQCEEPTEPPTIEVFISSASSIAAGESVWLSWVISGTQPVTLSIEPDIGDVSGTTGTSVTPNETTTYTLTATNETGTTSASTTVTLYQTLPPGEDPVAGTRLRPIASDCEASAMGQSCTLTIATTDSHPDEAFAAAQLMVKSPAFSLQEANPINVTAGCLSTAGVENVSIICDHALITGDGTIAEITLRREEPGDTTIDVLDVWLFELDGTQYAAGGGSLFVPASTPTPQPPTDLSATTISHERIDLTWTHTTSDRDGYRIEYRTGTCDGTFEPLTDLTATHTSYTHSGLAANTQYCYQIRTLQDDQSSAPSNTSSATTLTAPTTNARVTPTTTTCSSTTPGEQCTIWIELIDNDAALGGLEFEFTAPLFSLTHAQTSGIATTCIASSGPNLVGVICEPAFSGSGEVVTLTATRDQPGDSTFTTTNVTLIDPNGATTPATGGELPVPEFTCDIAHYADHPLGDFNADGVVSTPDALLILRTAVASLPAPEPGSYESYHADLNSDGMITTADALLALQKAVDPTRPARLAANPRTHTLDQSQTTCILIGNAGSQPLPDLTITTPDGITVTDITHDQAIGRVLQITRTTGTGTITIDANEAGALNITINP